MTTLLFVITLTTVLAGTWAQTFHVGSCPRPPVKENFDVNQYYGRWYQVQAMNFIIFQIGGVCVTATYTPRSDGSVEVKNQGLNRLTGGSFFIIGGASQPNLNSTEAGKLSVGFGDQNIFAANEGNYWVLDTDYESYTLIYSCTDLGFGHTDLLWILSRYPTISQSKVDELKALLASYGIEARKYLSSFDNSGCGEYYQTLL